MSNYGIPQIIVTLIEIVVNDFYGNPAWHGQGDQIGRNFAIWAIFYGVGRIFFVIKVAQ